MGGGEPVRARPHGYSQRHPRAGGDPGRISTWVRSVLLATLALLLAGAWAPALAVEPGEMLKDPALESRARAISQELRCLVCQNQSIDDSTAELARDLRILVRERLTAGDTDAAVLAFVEARYGEFVLLRPRLSLHTLLLWLTPVLILAAAGGALLRQLRRRPQTSTSDAGPALTREEQQRLDDLLKPPPA
jgi:cytochrome c-type biogenesis protein CcmH